jgi:hypothetical protein
VGSVALGWRATQGGMTQGCPRPSALASAASGSGLRAGRDLRRDQATAFLAGALSEAAGLVTDRLRRCAPE